MSFTVERWTTEELIKLNGIARQIMYFHGHTDMDELTRENCGTCVLHGYGEITEDGMIQPNYAGWERLYVESRTSIPEKYRAAFNAKLRSDDNPAYVDALVKSIATFAVRFV